VAATPVRQGFRPNPRRPSSIAWVGRADRGEGVEDEGAARLGGGVVAPPPDLEVARRWTRSRPEPARPGAGPDG